MSQPTKLWPVACVQYSEVVTPILAMFPTLTPTPLWNFSPLQTHPSQFWRLTEAKQKQEAYDHSVPSTRTKSLSSVSQFEGRRETGLISALQLPTLSPGCVGRRLALTLWFSTPSGVVSFLQPTQETKSHQWQHLPPKSGLWGYSSTHSKTRLISSEVLPKTFSLKDIFLEIVLES